VGCEDPDDRAFEEEQEADVGREPVPPGPEPVPDCGRADEHRQADEPEREVLQADVVGNAEVLEPHHVRLVLEPSLGEVEIRRRPDPEGELREGDEKRQAPGRAGGAPGRDPDPQGAADRDEDERGCHLRPPSEKITAQNREPQASAGRRERS
jgi:hypothetical protein